METTHLTTQKNLSLKEKRLVFLAGAAPAAAPPAPDPGKQKQEEINTLLVGEAKKSTLDKTTSDWALAEAETDSFIGKAKGWIDTADQSDDFKSEVSTGLKGLKKKYDQIKWAEITDADFATFKAGVETKLSELEAKATVDKAIKAKREEFTGTKLTGGIEAWAKAEPQVASLTDPMLTAVLNAVQTHMSGAEQDVLEALKAQEALLKAPTADLAAIQTALDSLPADVSVLLNNPVAYPSANQKVAEIKAYFIGVEMINDADKRFPFLDTDHTVPDAVTKPWNDKFDQYKEHPDQMPTLDKLVDEIKEAQTNVLLSLVIKDMTPENKAELTTLLKGKEVTPENISNFLEKYESFVYNSPNSADRQKVLAIVLGEIERQGIKDVEVAVEGGADAQAVSLKKGNEGKYKDMAAIGKRILSGDLAKMATIPQVKKYIDDGTIAALAANPDKFYEFIKAQITGADGRKDSAKEALWLGAGGVLNTLIFCARGNDIVGGPLVGNDKVRVGGYAAIAGGKDPEKRFGSVSFTSPNLCAATTCAPGVTTAPPVVPPEDPAVVAARELQEAKDKLQTERDRLKDPVIKTAKEFIVEVEADPKVNRDASISTKIHDLTDKITDLETEIAKPDGATKADVEAQITELLRLEGELDTAKTDLKTLRDALLAATISTPTSTPNTTGEFMGTEYSVDAAGNFIIKGTTHPLTPDEFSIVVGVDRPKDAYKKAKVERSYINPGLPLTVSYDAATKTITGKYDDTTGNTLETTYNIETGEKTAVLVGDLRPLLDPNDQSATKMEVIEAALVEDGLDLSSLASITLDNTAANPEAALNDLKEHLIKKEYKEALGILVLQAPQNVKLITTCIENLTVEITAGRIDTTKVPLASVIEAYSKPINTAEWEVFKKIKVGVLTGPDAEALVKSEKINPADLKAIFQEMIKEGANSDNPVLANAYIEKAFDKTPATVPEAINIKAIKAFTGDFSKVSNDVLDFIIANPTEFSTPDFISVNPASLGKLATILENTDITALPTNYEKIFKLLFPSEAAITTDLGPLGDKGAEMWAKYLKAQGIADLMSSKYGDISTAGDPVSIGLIDKALELGVITGIGAVTNPDAANILNRISQSSNPLAVEYTNKLIADMKAAALVVDPAIETAEQSRIENLYNMALDTTASYDHRSKALRMFIGTGIYKGMDVKDAAGAVIAAQGAVREDTLKTALATLHYENKKFTEITADTVEDKLPAEQKEFMEYYAGTKALDEVGMKFILGNKAPIGKDAIKALADSVFADNSQQCRLYKEIGMLEKTAEILASVTDPAEKQLLTTQLELVTKLYKDMNNAEQVKVKDELLKAYSLITAAVAGGAPGTPDSVKMRIIEQVFELSEKISSDIVDAATGERVRDGVSLQQMLNLLDSAAGTPDGHLNDIADQVLAGVMPLSDSDKLILRAKELRALVELARLTDNPSCRGGNCSIDNIVTDLDDYQSNLGPNPLKQMYGDQLLALYKVAPLAAANRTKFAAIMLKMAKQVANPADATKYLVGYDPTNAPLDLNPADFPLAEDKSKFLELTGKFLEAAAVLPAAKTAEKIVLIDMAKAAGVSDQNKLALAYEDVESQAAQVEAVKLYVGMIAADASKYLDAVRILSVVAAGPKKIEDGLAEPLVKTLPKAQKTIDLATTRGFVKTAFDVFSAAPAGSTIDVSMLNGAIAPTDAEIVAALGVPNKKVVGPLADKTALLTRLKTTSPEYALSPNTAEIDANLS